MNLLRKLFNQELDFYRTFNRLANYSRDESGAEASGGTKNALAGASMSIISYLLYAFAMMILAKRMDNAHGFGDYSAAIAAITIGATAGALGMEKYLLKLIPAYREKGAIDLLRGFRSFAPLASIAISLLVGLILFGIWMICPQGSALHNASLIRGIAFLPLIVLFAYYLELGTVDNRFLVSTMIYRVGFPLIFLGGIYFLHETDQSLMAEEAVTYWGICWAIGLGALLFFSKKNRIIDEHKGHKTYEPSRWLRESSSFMAYSLLMVLLLNGGVMVLGSMSTGRAQTAFFSVSLQVGSLLVILLTAVNRWYGPKLSAVLSANDICAEQRVLQSYRRVTWSLCGVYVLFMVLFAKWILGLYGKEYLACYDPLVIIIVGTTFNGMNSIAPIYIQYAGKPWTVPLILVCAVLLNFSLLVPFAYLWNSTGAALAYSITIILLFTTFQIQAQRIRRSRLHEHRDSLPEAMQA